MMVTKDYKNMVAPGDAPKQETSATMPWLAGSFIAGVITSSLVWLLLWPTSKPVIEVPSEILNQPRIAAKAPEINRLPIKAPDKPTNKPIQNEKPVAVEVKKIAIKTTDQPQATEYDFYSELKKNQEVVVEIENKPIEPKPINLPEKKPIITGIIKPVIKQAPKIVTPSHKTSKSSHSNKPVRQPAPESAGRYILQVASYRHQGDAQNMRQQLLRHGIQTRIYTAPVNGKGVFFRLKTEAFSLEYINNLRGKLRNNGINPRMIRVE